MSIDHKRVFRCIETGVASDGAISRRMASVIKECASSFPHSDWDKLSSLPYDGEVAVVDDIVSNIVSDAKCRSIGGLYVGVNNPDTLEYGITAGYYCGTTEQYSPNDDAIKWAFSCRYYPSYAVADSANMRSIYSIAYSSEAGLRNDAEWPLCLALPAMSFADVARRRSLSFVIAVGFDSGDFLIVHRGAR